MTDGRATVVQVAQRAGVSIASVSRTLSGKAVRPDTANRVRLAVADLGYLPDARARSLKLGSTRQIAFAVDDLANPVYTQMMRGVEAGLAAGADKSRLLVASVGHHSADLLELVAGLHRGYADGLIISPLRHSFELLAALVAAPVPVVVVGNVGTPSPLDNVRTDSGLGIQLAHAHLVAGGRQRIAFVNGPTNTAPGRSRQAGYLEACARRGRAGPILTMDAFTVGAGERAWAQLRTIQQRPDAVLAANDLLALGVLRAALSDGVLVPEHVAVAGIDDIEFARIFSPSLTTVSLHAGDRGQLAAELLLDRIDTPGRLPRSRALDPVLIVREST